MGTMKQEKAIELILRGETDGEVGEKIGTTRETVNKWRNHDAEFRAELSARRNQLWEQHRDELAALYRQAIEVLRRALNSPQENVRIRAALGIAKFPAIQAYLKPEIPAKEEGIDMLEILGMAVNQLEAEGRGVVPKKDALGVD